MASILSRPQCVKYAAVWWHIGQLRSKGGISVKNTQVTSVLLEIEKFQNSTQIIFTLALIFW